MSVVNDSIITSSSVLIDEKIAHLKYDKTVIATIVDDAGAKTGKYIVNEGSMKFEAYSNNTSLSTNDQVYVTIPQGDFTQQKIIIGKYYANTNSPVIYTTLSDRMLFISDNLSNEFSDAIGIIVNTAKNAETSKLIYQHDFTKDENMMLQKNNVLDCLGIRATFKSVLTQLYPNMISGNYGLRIKLTYKDSYNNKQVKEVRFDLPDFVGDPYSFIIPAQQEKLVDITSLGDIVSLDCYLFENGGFTYLENEDKKYCHDEDMVPSNSYDIYVNNLEIYLGLNLTKIPDNTFQIYSFDNTTNSKIKNIFPLWINKDTDNKYLGFSDGIYSLADYKPISAASPQQPEGREYREDVYRKELEYINRGSKLDMNALGNAQIANIQELLQTYSYGQEIDEKLIELKEYIETSITKHLNTTADYIDEQCSEDNLLYFIDLWNNVVDQLTNDWQKTRAALMVERNLLITKIQSWPSDDTNMTERVAARYELEAIDNKLLQFDDNFIKIFGCYNFLTIIQHTVPNNTTVNYKESSDIPIASKKLRFNDKIYGYLRGYYSTNYTNYNSDKNANVNYTFDAFKINDDQKNQLLDYLNVNDLDSENKITQRLSDINSLFTEEKNATTGVVRGITGLRKYSNNTTLTSVDVAALEADDNNYTLLQIKNAMRRLLDLKIKAFSARHTFLKNNSAYDNLRKNILPTNANETWTSTYVLPIISTCSADYSLYLNRDNTAYKLNIYPEYVALKTSITNLNTLCDAVKTSLICPTDITSIGDNDTSFYIDLIKLFQTEQTQNSEILQTLQNYSSTAENLFLDYKNLIKDILNRIEKQAPENESLDIEDMPLIFNNGFSSNDPYGINEQDCIVEDKSFECMDTINWQLASFVKQFNYLYIEVYDNHNDNYGGTILPYDQKRELFLNSFNNRYSIYWYRYNPDDIEENEKINKQANFLSNEWQLINSCLDVNSNQFITAINEGMPQQGECEKVTKEIWNSELNIYETITPNNNYYWKKYFNSSILSFDFSNFTREEEMLQAVIIYNHTIYRSNILTFTNTEDNNVNNSLRILTTNKTNSKKDTYYNQKIYQLYDSSNLLINQNDASLTRTLKACYNNDINNSYFFDATQANNTYVICWLVPSVSTMLNTNTLNLTDEKGFKKERTGNNFVYIDDNATDLNVESNKIYLDKYTQLNYTMFYKKITKPNTTTAVDCFEFYYKIAEVYNSAYLNNTIICKIVGFNANKKEILNCTDDVSFLFATYGTNGTNYTLSVYIPNEDKTQQTAVCDSADHPLMLRAQVLNPDGNFSRDLTSKINAEWLYELRSNKSPTYEFEELEMSIDNEYKEFKIIKTDQSDSITNTVSLSSDTSNFILEFTESNEDECYLIGSFSNYNGSYRAHPACKMDLDEATGWYILKDMALGYSGNNTIAIGQVKNQELVRFTYKIDNNGTIVTRNSFTVPEKVENCTIVFDPTGAKKPDQPSTKAVWYNNYLAVIPTETFSYYVLKFFVDVDIESTTVDDQVQVSTKTLSNYYPIPWSKYTDNSWYNLNGPTKIIYDDTGVRPQYYDEEIRVLNESSQHISLEDEKKLNYEIIAFSKKTNTIYTDKYLTVNGKPKLICMNKQNNYFRLSMPNSYIGDNDTFFLLQIKKETDPIFYQPLFITFNKYMCQMLNDWNGALTIDEDNNAILAATLVAGTKHMDNTFSGTIIGNIGKIKSEVSSDDKNELQGIYGYNHGEQSYAFKNDGTAFIGKAGHGRIEFDGSQGIIKSSSYNADDLAEKKANLFRDLIGSDSVLYDTSGEMNLEQVFNNNGLVNKSHMGTGVKIDLDDGLIDMKGLELKSASELGDDALKEAELEARILRSQNYLTNMQAVNLMTDDEIEVFFNSYTNNGTNNLSSNELSTWRSLTTDTEKQEFRKQIIRKITSEHLLNEGKKAAHIYTKPSGVNVRLATSDPYFQITTLVAPDSSKPKEQKEIPIIRIGKSEYFFQSPDFINSGTNKQGVQLDLAHGTLYAYKFTLEAGTSSKIRLSSTSPFFQITNNNNVNLIKISSSEYFLQSASKNIKLDLNNGKFTLDDGKTSSYAIQLSNSGSPFLSIGKTAKVAGGSDFTEVAYNTNYIHIDKNGGYISSANYQPVVYTSSNLNKGTEPLHSNNFDGVGTNNGWRKGGRGLFINLNSGKIFLGTGAAIVGYAATYYPGHTDIRHRRFKIDNGMLNYDTQYNTNHFIIAQAGSYTNPNNLETIFAVDWCGNVEIKGALYLWQAGHRYKVFVAKTNNMYYLTIGSGRDGDIGNATHDSGSTYVDTNWT